jgi:hypothetical protein
MGSILVDAGQWTQKQFAGAQLGDFRRGRRLVQVASALARTRSGVLAKALQGWAELKAAYRLMDMPQVSRQAVQEPHLAGVRAAVEEPGVYLIIEDTTDIDLTHRRDLEGTMGWIGDGRGIGFWLHTSLAARLEGYDQEGRPRVGIVGLLAQHAWQRTHPPRRKRETRAQRARRAERESDRWAKVFEEISAPAEATWIYVADREGDIYETFERCMQAGARFVVRAKHARALDQEAGNLFDTVAATAPVGSYQIPLRARPGMAARRAAVEVRRAVVRLRAPWRADSVHEPLELTVLEVRETAPPPAADSPIHWRLLTDLPCEDWQAVRRAIGCYARRWLIEEYHKALKSGLGMEETQLATPERILTLCGILGVVACWLLELKCHAEAEPDELIEPASISPTALSVLKGRYGEPARGWTWRSLLISIARLGGFLARNSDGLPGWQTLWRGMQALHLLEQGFLLAKQEKPRCG